MRPKRPVARRQPNDHPAVNNALSGVVAKKDSQLLEGEGADAHKSIRQELNEAVAQECAATRALAAQGPAGGFFDLGDEPS